MIKLNHRHSVPDNIDKVLWRYIKIQKLELILKKQALFFPRSDLLGDEHEGSYSRPSIEYRKIFYEGATQHFLEEGLPEDNKDWRLFTFISCWHVDENESYAMWKLYSNKNKAIAIKSTIFLLKKAILDTEHEFCFFPVNYIDYEKDYIPESNAFSPFFYKRDIYMHEREFRILTDEVEKINDYRTNKCRPKKGLYIKIDVNTLINAIVVSPYSSDQYNNDARALLEKYNLSHKLMKSKIPRTPQF